MNGFSLTKPLLLAAAICAASTLGTVEAAAPDEPMQPADVVSPFASEVQFLSGSDGDRFVITAERSDIAEVAAESIDREVASLIARLADARAEIRSEAANRLGEIGPEASPAFGALVVALRDDDAVVRIAASQAIWAIERRADVAVTELSDLLISTQPGITTLSAYVLGNMGAEARDALPALRQALLTGTAAERVHLAEAILKIAPDENAAVDALIALLHETDRDVRMQAAFALGSVRPQLAQRITTPLLTALQDDDVQVRTAARLTLESLISSSSAAIAANAAADSAGLTRQERTALFERTFGQPAPTRDTNSTANRAMVSRQLGTTFQQATYNQAGGAARAYAPSARLKTVHELTTDTVPSEGELPPNHAAAQLAKVGTIHSPMGTSRPWELATYEWNAPALWHRPVYFEEDNAERYGNSFGPLAPAVSMGLFYARMPMLPYKMATYPPDSQWYELGYYRPGDRTPYQFTRPQLKLWPPTFQGILTTAAIFAIP